MPLTARALSASSLDWYLEPIYPPLAILIAAGCGEVARRLDHRRVLHTGGAELDLLVCRGNLRRGFEMKLTTSPQATPSMRSALATLKLDELTVIHAGTDSYPLAPHIRAVALPRLGQDLPPLP